MKITAQRAADKVEAQNAFVGKAGRQRTVAEFRAGKYLRRVRSLVKKVNMTMRMLVQEEPKVLRAICLEKRRAIRLTRRARRATTRPSCP
jgi:hypothetical protein